MSLGFSALGAVCLSVYVLMKSKNTIYFIFFYSQISKQYTLNLLRLLAHRCAGQLMSCVLSPTRSSNMAQTLNESLV